MHGGRTGRKVAASRTTPGLEGTVPAGWFLRRRRIGFGFMVKKGFGGDDGVLGGFQDTADGDIVAVCILWSSAYFAV